MFDSIGWGEIFGLGLCALFIFGPERLPSFAKDAAHGLKKARDLITGARAEIKNGLGDEFAHLADIDLRQYRPATFLREHLTDDPVRQSLERKATRAPSKTTLPRSNAPTQFHPEG